VCVKAADRCDLGSGPNVGTSDRWQLDVVTPDQLRTMLQGRELVLRQRFEVVVKEVGDTRDTLARIDLNPAPAGGKAKPERAPKKGAEPEDKPADEEPLSPERQLAQRQLQVQWAAQNSIKNAQETLGVAEAISEIREELVNNRIDTEELKARLESGIADPLRQVAREMFPELERRLDQLQAELADPARGPQARTQAIQQSDAILLAMREVLDRMIELEDFNEAVELLRSIIHAQERVNAQTKERQKQKLRELLE
jgi:predicted DNA-binding protein